MQYDFLDSQAALDAFCHDSANARIIAFDTEFISEHSYRPELCLIQVAADDRLAVIDPLAAIDLTPFWERLVLSGHRTIVHAGREELRFCLHAVGKCPHDLLDVQIAAALVGMEYPAALSTLVSRLLGKSLSKGETRTDWRRRPLTTRQIEYALHDVLFLEQIGEELLERLQRMKRESWLSDEMESWQRAIEAFETSKRWMRTGGIAGLSRRALAIVREIWTWRESEALKRNQPPKRILRDDLLVELARRQTDDIKRMKAVRGMERSDVAKHLPAIAQAIGIALDLPEAELPTLERRSQRSQLNVLGQFLGTALGSICRAADVSPSIVGTAQDVRDLIAYRLGLCDDDEPIPALAQGWRAQVVGKVIEQLLAGQLAVCVTDPHAEEPLSFQAVSPGPGEPPA